MKLVTSQEMRAIEKGAVAQGISLDTLMENAGLEAAKEVSRSLGEIAGHHLLFLIGPGNNGGDGLVAARHLHTWGARVHLYLPQPREDRKFILCQEAGISYTLSQGDEGFVILEGQLSQADAIIDALFGTGKLRPLQQGYGTLLERVKGEKAKRAGLFIFALDLPSGLDADTGRVDPMTLPADVTITIGYPKRGLFAFPGRHFTGKLKVVDIGFPSHLTEGWTTELLTPPWVKSMLPARPLEAHKGSFGRVLVVSGSRNYIGAAYLACEAAARVGAGLVTLAAPGSLQPILATKLTEVTYIPLAEREGGFISGEALSALEEWLPLYDTFLMGCGIGQREETTEFLHSLLAILKGKPMVLDADALNILSKKPHWWQGVQGDAILTPHPAEMSRLSKLPLEDIQSDRIESARRMAKEWGKVVVLKGAHSVIASPRGEVRLSPIANPGLASAGTGDVLAGAIAGLLAQQLAPFDAASAGVYLHGLAGEMVKEEMGDAGMLASDLLPVLPRVIMRLKGEGFKGLCF